jgi:hypothetical protein
MKTLAKILMTLMIITSVADVSEAKVLFSEKVGGTNGTDFMLPSTRFDILSTEDITRIVIRHGRRVESIEIEYANRRNIKQSEAAGNHTGQLSFFELEKGEFITYITGRAGTLIDQITFHTSMRRAFGPYGGTGGQDFEINIPSNAKVIGFTGKEGPSIKQIGLIYRTYERDSDGPQGPGNVGNQTPEAPEVFENSPQSPIIQTAPIPPATKQIRDHRKNNDNSSIIRDSIRGTKYTPGAEDFDIRQIIIMNGRGNQEQLAKETTTSIKRNVRDHRNSAGSSGYHVDSIRVMNYIYPGKEKDNQSTLGMNGRGNQEQEVKRSINSTTRNIRDHRKKK